MTVFRINYSKVISQADTINRLAGDFHAQIRQFEAMEQDVRSNWKGQAADAFLGQTAALRADMNITYRKTIDLSNTIKNAAFRIQREDEAAEARVRQLAQSKK